MDTTTLSSLSVSQDREEFTNHLFEATLGAFTMFSIYLGHQLGFYKVLAGGDALTPRELAQRTGTYERYTREWLEQQAASCILEVANHTHGDERRYSLTPGRAEVLTDRDSLSYMAPLAQAVVGSIKPMDSLLQAYRTGSGVAFSQYGLELRDGQADMNRPMFLKQLGSEWLPQLPELHARLMADPPARVADIGCGGAWSSIGIALRYPNARVDGYDLDESSVDLARQNIQASGVSDRVQVFQRDASDPSLQGHYDLVVAFECLHDMSNPVGTLRNMRSLAGDHGTVLIMDERANEEFQACADSVEKLLYGFSILHCLPAGMAEQPSAATGTVFRPGTMQRYAAEAGFSQVEVLPIDHFLFRFYRLSG